MGGKLEHFYNDTFKDQMRDLNYYRWDLENQEGCGVVAHERLTEPRVTMEWLLAKPNSLSNIPAFLDPNGILNPEFFLADFLSQRLTKCTDLKKNNFIYILIWNSSLFVFQLKLVAPAGCAV